jgi:hypothetical protein
MHLLFDSAMLLFGAAGFISHKVYCIRRDIRSL